MTRLDRQLDDRLRGQSQDLLQHAVPEIRHSARNQTNGCLLEFELMVKEHEGIGDMIVMLYIFLVAFKFVET